MQLIYVLEFMRAYNYLFMPTLGADGGVLFLFPLNDPP